MKKKILIALLVIINLFAIQAIEVNSYITSSYNYGLFTIKEKNNKTILTSNALDLSASSYFTDNFGIYLNTNYNFINTIKNSNDTVIYTFDTSLLFRYAIVASVIIAPSIKYSLSNNFQIFCNIGPHIANTGYSYRDLSYMSISLGIGGDIGLRCMVYNNFYLTAGSLFSFDFFTSLITSTIEDGFSQKKYICNYKSIRPYLGLGIKIKDHTTF